MDNPWCKIESKSSLQTVHTFPYLTWYRWTLVKRERPNPKHGISLFTYWAWSTRLICMLLIYDNCNGTTSDMLAINKNILPNHCVCSSFLQHPNRSNNCCRSRWNIPKMPPLACRKSLSFIQQIMHSLTLVRPQHTVPSKIWHHARL